MISHDGKTIKHKSAHSHYSYRFCSLCNASWFRNNKDKLNTKRDTEKLLKSFKLDDED